MTLTRNLHIMEEPEWHHKPVDSLDVNALLNNGFWKTSRSKSPSNTASPTYLSPRSSFLGPSPSPTNLRPRYISRPDWPPSPSVEDETESLAREISTSSTPDSTDEPPCRGEFEQHPIILEADGSGHVLNKDSPQSPNSERRFVLHSYTPPESDDEASSGEISRKREARGTKVKESDDRKRDERRLSDNPSQLGRKKSHQDLPNLNTKIDPPPFRRSTSAYSFVPPKEESKHFVRTPDVLSGEKSKHFDHSPETPRREELKPRQPIKPKTYLHPHDSDGSTPTGRGQSPGYFDIGVGSRHSSRSEHPTPRSEHSTPRPKTPSDKPKSPSEARRPENLRSPGSRPPPRSDVDDIRRDRSGHHTNSEDDRKVRHRHHHRHKSSTLHPDQIRESGRDDDRHHRSHSKSRHTSPMPSPRSSQSRYETLPPVRRPAHSDSDSSESRESTRLKSDLWDRPLRKPNPVPGVDYEYVESIPPEVTAPLEPHLPAPPSYWKPSEDHQPVGSYRRYSEDIENGVVQILPGCPRKDFVRGYTDWYTIPGCPSFDICPSCFKLIAGTPYCNQFARQAPRDPSAAILCDFGSSIWLRIAWLLINKEGYPDIKLMVKLADILRTHPKCTRSENKIWYSIPDPQTGKPIPNFSVCSACVASISVILPATRNIFTRIDNPSPRPCSMRFDNKKFVRYFDALETSSASSLPTLIAHIAAQSECTRDAVLLDDWFTITQIPDFKACHQCYEEVVRPLQRRDKAIALMVGTRRGWGSCVLAEPRFRRVFKECVDVDDYRGLVDAIKGLRGE